MRWLPSAVIACFAVLAGCSSGGATASDVPVADGRSPAASGAGGVEVVHVSDVVWEQLNPARGDQSPKAATIWGDRSGTGPTGFLFHPVDGFRSPPHVHNVSYRGVVIRGLVHNADEAAAEVWMPAGSFWTQPKGGPHITAAKGTDVLAYIEIDEGPYLVRPVDKAFESGEQPVNLDASSIAWRPAVIASPPTAMVAPLWGETGDGQLSGSLVKLAADTNASIMSHGTLRAVVIQGTFGLGVGAARDGEVMPPGSYFSSKEPSRHRVSCGPGEDCVLYARAKGRFDVRVDAP